MKLSDILPEKKEIIRDGTFSSLGTLFSHFPHQVVYAVRQSDAETISCNKSVSCVITIPSLVSRIPDSLGVVVSEDPRGCFYTLQSLLRPYPEFNLQPFQNQISPSAKIHPSAVIPQSGVIIGRDVVIDKHVIIREQTVIDDGSVIRPNSQIGNAPSCPGAPVHSPEIQPSGGVHLHREVDIHANCRIHCALFKGFTEIGEQTKIDNLSTIGPGTVTGKRCLFCGGVTVGESVVMGDDGWIGPNAVLKDQIRIGNTVYITIGSTVTHDIDDDKVVKDDYAVDRKRFKKVMRGM